MTLCPVVCEFMLILEASLITISASLSQTTTTSSLKVP